MRPSGEPGVGDWRKKSLLDSIVRSLLRLKTDRVDLIHLHTCSEEDLRKGEVIEALQVARDKGYTRYIGYSGDHAAARYAVECGVFDSLQTSVNIADQEAIDLTLPLARERGMAVIAKRPIANAAWRYPGKPTNCVSPDVLGAATKVELRLLCKATPSRRPRSHYGSR